MFVYVVETQMITSNIKTITVLILEVIIFVDKLNASHVFHSIFLYLVTFRGYFMEGEKVDLSINVHYNMTYKIQL